EGAQDVLLLEGVVDPSGGEFLQQVQLLCRVPDYGELDLVAPCPRDRIGASLRIIRRALPGTEAGPSVPERDPPGKRTASKPYIQGDLTIGLRSTIGGSIPSPTLDAPGTGRTMRTDPSGEPGRVARISAFRGVGHSGLPIIRDSA